MSIQFLKAVVVGVWYAIWHRRNPLGRAVGFFRLLGQMARRQYSSYDVVRDRNLECQKCPLFYRPLGTCGSPLDEENPDLGCWCHCRTKNKLKGATCWLREETRGKMGWPETLYEQRT